MTQTQQTEKPCSAACGCKSCKCGAACACKRKA
jgi:hypothetical protein